MRAANDDQKKKDGFFGKDKASRDKMEKGFAAKRTEMQGRQMKQREALSATSLVASAAAAISVSYLM